MLEGVLHLLLGGGDVDVHQLLIHLVHPIDEGWVQCVQKRGHHGHILASPGEGRALPTPPPLPSRLRLTIIAHSASSVDMRWCSLASWASMATCSPAS
jgi:hypothetical protein